PPVVCVMSLYVSLWSLLDDVRGRVNHERLGSLVQWKAQLSLEGCVGCVRLATGGDLAGLNLAGPSGFSLSGREHDPFKHAERVARLKSLEDRTAFEAAVVQVTRAICKFEFGSEWAP